MDHSESSQPLDAPREERWRRVQARNAEKGATYQLPFAVTRDMFDFVETLWEPPTDQELARCNGIRVGYNPEQIQGLFA